MLARETVSLFLTSLLHTMIVTKETTQTPRSGHTRRNTTKCSSRGSLQDTGGSNTALISLQRSPHQTQEQLTIHDIRCLYLPGNEPSSCFAFAFFPLLKMFFFGFISFKSFNLELAPISQRLEQEREGVPETTVAYLDNPICLDMTSHCEQLSPMAMWRGGYVYSTVWKHTCAKTNTRLVTNTARIKFPV